MEASKTQLIKICDELFEKKIIGQGMLRDKKYDICNGFIECSLKPKNPETRKLIWDNFEKLGFIVKSGAYSYIRIYWADDNINEINKIFKKYM
jgi:hypothetical protein